LPGDIYQQSTGPSAASLGDDPGIVDQHVEAACLFDDSVESCLPVDLAGDIELTSSGLFY